MKALLLVLALAGCDTVFGLSRPPDAPAEGMPMACRPLPSMASWVFTEQTISLGAPINGFTIRPHDVIYARDGTLYETGDVTVVGSPVPFLANLGGTLHSTPELSADGMSLTYEELQDAFTSAVWFAQRSDKTTWTMKERLVLPYQSNRARPGPMVRLASGVYRIVVSFGGTLVELESADRKAWTKLMTLGFSDHSLIDGADDLDPYLTPDGCWLFFSSNRAVNGNYDIWVTSRTDPSRSFEFPTAVPGLAADPNINAGEPTMVPDGSELWFLDNPNESGARFVRGVPP